MTTAAQKSLILSKPNASGRPLRVGTLIFPAGGRVILSTEGSGAEVEQLKKDWADISQMKELTWKHDEVETVDGETTRSLVGSAVKPGENNYFDAVLSTLERSYGYRVEIGQ